MRRFPHGACVTLVFVLITPLPLCRDLLVMGGDSAKDQIKALQAGVEIVTGTPGRLDDLITTGKLDLSAVSYVCAFYLLTISLSILYVFADSLFYSG